MRSRLASLRGPPLVKPEPDRHARSSAMRSNTDKRSYRRSSGALETAYITTEKPGLEPEHRNQNHVGE